MKKLLSEQYKKTAGIFSAVFVIVVLSLFVFSKAQAATGINPQLNFQGKLVDSSGLNVSDGSRSVVFSIYDVSSGGTALWSETQSVTTTDGIFRVALGSSTPFPANFNFNWDGLYLGIKVASDSEMTPRVRLSAVPYAFNSQKVAGLTVQDTSGNASTSGILQVANGKTVTFGDAFSTTVGNSIALTTSGATTLTLPTTGTLITLAGSEILTNKTIGSTGLTFSGATTDVTTGTNEDFILSPNGTGKISFGTTSPLGYLTLEGKATGKSLGIFNQLTGGDQDLFSASQAGTTKFTIANSGNITATGTLSGLTGLTLASGPITLGGSTGSGLCIVGGAAAAWGSCGSGGVSYWQNANAGAISPFVDSTEVLVGSTATSSAMIRLAAVAGQSSFFNGGNVGIGSTSPTAKLDVAGNVNIQGYATASASLSVGYSSVLAGTGNGVFSGNVGIGSSAPSERLDINGNIHMPAGAYIDIGSGYRWQESSGNFILLGDNGLQVKNRANSAWANMSADTYKANVGGATGVSFGNGDASLGLGFANGGGFSFLSGSSSLMYLNTTGNLGIGSTSPNGLFDVEGKATGKALVTVNQLTGGDQDLFTASQAGVTKFTIFNTGAASHSGMMTVGDGTASNNVVRTSFGPLVLQYKSMGNAWSTGVYLQDVTGNVGIGTTNPGTTLTLGTGQISVPLGASGNPSYSFAGDTDTGLYSNTANQMILAAGGGQKFQVATSFIRSFVTHYLTNGSAGTPALAYVSDTDTGIFFPIENNLAISNGGVEKLRIDGNGNVGIGSTTPIGLLNIDGKATGKALGILNQLTGGDQDLFSASQAGTTKFTIANSGNITATGTLSGLTGLTLASGGINLGGTVGTGTQCLLGGATASWSTCPGGSAGTNYWQNANAGAISPFVDSTEVLVGSTATSSAMIRLAAVAGQSSFFNGGNVGIGSSAPVARLDMNGTLAQTNGQVTLAGNVDTTSGLDVSGANLTVGGTAFTVDTTGAITSTKVGTALTLSGAGATFAFSGAGLATISTASNQSLNLAPGGTGNVGIGSTTPIGLFNIDGKATGKSLSIINQLTNGDQNLFTASQAGVTKFTIANTGAASMAGMLTFGDGTATNNVLRTPYGPLILQYKSAANTWATGFYLQDVTGNIGIGSTAPGAILDVVGSSRITGGLSGLTGLTLTSGAITLGGSTGSGQCITGGASAAWGSCGSGGGGISYLDQTNGLTFIGQTTTDFAIGGTSTSSAKFVFGSMNSGVPTATFSGDLIINNKPTTGVTGMQRWTKITGTAGTIGGGTAGVASISASVVYNGSLYVGTNNANNAEIYRYDGEGAGTWTKVSGTAGTVGGNATTAIDMISSLTVYNGYLYAGTQETDKAEVYRYNGGSSWTQLNVTGTAGKLLTTTTIDGISSMAVFGGRLFVGTKENAKAEIYMYNGGTTWIAVTGTAGTLLTTNTVLVDAVTQMVVWNNTLIVGTLRNAGDADVLRWNGIVGGSANFFALNLASTTGSYLIDNAAQTGYTEVSSMAVWAGKLVVGLRRTASVADILMYQEPPSGAAPINSWTRLNSAAGTIGTANIDSVTAMTVYGGRLYVGTTEPNGAEIYRYDGEKSWTKVSQNTAGTIASGGTGSIDGISTLISYNHNSLFAGTLEGTTAEGYMYNVSIDQSYALKFSAGASQGGGIQNNNQNLGQIFFVASLSANVNNKAGNTGSFVFSHSITTNNGSYDVAEDYPTRDDTIEPGDVVSIDPNERGFVKKSEGDYDYTAIGVYSEKPALRLSQDEASMNGGRAIPIALAGRVPVKVMTENGHIKPGDPLTPSSIPGVAMKAKKSGLIIGQAMESYDGKGVGKVMAYIKSSSYQGSVADSFMNIDSRSNTFGADTLAALEIQDSTSSSQIVTDILIAGLQIVTPHLTAHEVSLDTISIASGSALKVNLGSDGTISFAGVENTGVILFDSLGNATFGGTVTAKRIKAEQIEGLELIVDRLINRSSDSDFMASISAQTRMDMLFAQVLGSATVSAVPSFSLTGITRQGLSTVSGDLRVRGSTLLEGIVNIVDTLVANNLLVNGFSTFFDTVIFKKDVRFEGRQLVGKDSAGTVTIEKGNNSVDVIFAKEYDSLPIVNANVVIDKVEREEDQKKADDRLLSQETSFVIVHRTKKGFTILLKKTAQDDLQFSWAAVMVLDPFLLRTEITPTLAPPD